MDGDVLFRVAWLSIAGVLGLVDEAVSEDGVIQGVSAAVWPDLFNVESDVSGLECDLRGLVLGVALSIWEALKAAKPRMGSVSGDFVDIVWDDVCVLLPFRFSDDVALKGLSVGECEVHRLAEDCRLALGKVEIRKTMACGSAKLASLRK